MRISAVRSNDPETSSAANFIQIPIARPLNGRGLPCASRVPSCSGRRVSNPRPSAWEAGKTAAIRLFGIPTEESSDPRSSNLPCRRRRRCTSAITEKRSRPAFTERLRARFLHNGSSCRDCNAQFVKKREGSPPIVQKRYAPRLTAPLASVWRHWRTKLSPPVAVTGLLFLEYGFF